MTAPGLGYVDEFLPAHTGTCSPATHGPAWMTKGKRQERIQADG